MSQLSSIYITTKLLIEVCGVLLLGGVFLVIHRQVPFHRGFFCDDKSISKPFVEDQTVPATLATIIWTTLILITIVPIEFLRNAMITERGTVLPRLCGLVPLPAVVVDIYRTLGHCILGGLATLLITEIAKITIGRLRPHFLTLCQPDISLCHVNETYFWVANETRICSSLQIEVGPEKDLLMARMNEARLSFLSGHTSLSFYSAVFLALYLQTRLATLLVPSSMADNIRKYFRVCKPFFQAFYISMAFYISLTRISDYFHHPLDVACGALVGITMAILTHLYSKIDKQPAAFASHFKGARLQDTRSANASMSMSEPYRQSNPSKTMEDFVKTS